jgi:ankyrin repeat protein
MIRIATVVVALLIAASVFAQNSEPRLYGELASLFSDVISANLAEKPLPCTWPSPAVLEKQALLTSALSEATPSTGPLVLLYAVTANSLEDVRRLYEGGASPEDPWGTLLHDAARFGNSVMLDYLVSIGFGLEDHGAASGPALLVAAMENRLDNVKWLVENGADVNATDTRGVPVIRFALACRNQQLVDYLLDAGATPDQVTRERAPGLGISLGDR